jgi:hypothetical protein
MQRKTRIATVIRTRGSFNNIKIRTKSGRRGYGNNLAQWHAQYFDILLST